MAGNDNILHKPDPRDLENYGQFLDQAMQAKRKIETGFIELAESILSIHKKKLYRIQYKTFEEFCNEELGFSRQTIYIYIGILKLIATYPKYFPREKVINFGHKKMRHITEGTNAIDRKINDEQLREEKKIKIFEVVSPDMSATQIEVFIDDLLSELDFP